MPRRHGEEVVPRDRLAYSVLAAVRESGQATIATIKHDGLERITSLNDTNVEFYQFLPLYDLCHLGNVMRQGFAPTTGEMTWALVDGCFVVADALSLVVVQPKGVVAAEAVCAEVKAATRETAKAIGREAVEGSNVLRVEIRRPCDDRSLRRVRFAMDGRARPGRHY